MRIKILITCSILFIINSFSGQTFNEIVRISSFYDQSFETFEKQQNVRNIDSEIKFGAESRAYSYNNFHLLLTGKDDSVMINEIEILLKKHINNQETWYNICKYADKDPAFTFFDSFISDSENELFRKKITFTELLNILRKSSDTSNYIYCIVYKSNNLYYQFNVVKSEVFIKITPNYKLKS